MKIDKLAPFYTVEDIETLSKYDLRLASFLNDARRLSGEIQAAKESGAVDLLKDLVDISKAFWPNQYAKREESRQQLLLSIEQRLIDSYKGNISAILADIREIVNAVEKKEYLDHQKRREADFKELLEATTGKDSFRARYKAVKALSTRGYKTCYYYIMEQVRVQFNALAFYESDEGLDEAVAIVEKKAASFYSKPKALDPEQNSVERIPTVDVTICGKLLPIPTSPAMTLMYDLLGGVDLDHLPERKKKYNRNIPLEIKKNGDKRRISYSKGGTSVSVEIDDFRKVVNRNPQAKKILTRILIRASEQAIHNGELTRDLVSFPLSELIGEGQYKNQDTARKGFYTVGDILTGLKVSGKIERGRKKTIQQGVHAVLFKAVEINNSTCKVYLNELLNWALITPYYTGLPDYYFELPDRPAELLEYIFYMARQKSRQIAEHGFFTISLRAIQYRLNLPSEDSTKNPKRDIKDAIETAVDQILDKHVKYVPSGSDPDFLLVPLRDYNAPIKKYLDEGKLKVIIKGGYADRFIALNQKKVARLEAEMERQERIEAKIEASKRGGK